MICMLSIQRATLEEFEKCFDDFVQYFPNTQSGGENTNKHIRKREGKLLQKKNIVVGLLLIRKHAHINVTGNVSTVHEIVNRYYSSRCCNSVDSVIQNSTCMSNRLGGITISTGSLSYGSTSHVMIRSRTGTGHLVKNIKREYCSIIKYTIFCLLLF